MYDDRNIFAQILNKKIKINKVFENKYAISFWDIAPVAPIHVLVIPKGKYKNYSDFISNAKNDEINGYYKSIQHTLSALNITDGSYRLISNCKSKSGQTVMHFHTHIISGKELTSLI